MSTGQVLQPQPQNFRHPQNRIMFFLTTKTSLATTWTPYLNIRGFASANWDGVAHGIAAFASRFPHKLG